MAVAMTGAVMNRARCVVPSHTIYPVARPCAVRTHHSQSHKAARLPSRLLRPAFNTAAAERAVLGLWPSIRPVTCIDSELGSTLTVRRAHRELLAAACIDINVVRKVIVTPHCGATSATSGERPGTNILTWSMFFTLSSKGCDPGHNSLEVKTLASGQVFCAKVAYR